MNNHIFKVLVCALLCGTSVQANLGSIDPTEPIDAAEFKCSYNAYHFTHDLNSFNRPYIEDTRVIKRIIDQKKLVNWQAFIDSVPSEEVKNFTKEYLKGDLVKRSSQCAGIKRPMSYSIRSPAID